jgi:hypothetical protein
LAWSGLTEHSVASLRGYFPPCCLSTPGCSDHSFIMAFGCAESIGARFRVSRPLRRNECAEENVKHIRPGGFPFPSLSPSLRSPGCTPPLSRPRHENTLTARNPQLPASRRADNAPAQRHPRALHTGASLPFPSPPRGSAIFCTGPSLPHFLLPDRPHLNLTPQTNQLG